MSDSEILKNLNTLISHKCIIAKKLINVIKFLSIICPYYDIKIIVVHMHTHYRHVYATFNNAFTLY